VVGRHPGQGGVDLGRVLDGGQGVGGQLLYHGRTGHGGVPTAGQGPGHRGQLQSRGGRNSHNALGGHMPRAVDDGLHMPGPRPPRPPAVLAPARLPATVSAFVWWLALTQTTWAAFGLSPPLTSALAPIRASVVLLVIRSTVTVPARAAVPGLTAPAAAKSSS